MLSHADDDENRLFIDVDQKKKGHNKTQPKDDDERKQKFAAYMKGVGCNIEDITVAFGLLYSPSTSLSQSAVSYAHAAPGRPISDRL